MKNITLNLGLYLFLMVLQGCATPVATKDKPFPRYHQQQNTEKKEKRPEVNRIALQHRLAWPELETGLPVKTQEPLFSLVVKNEPLEKALSLFSRAYDLNILVDQGISGTVNIEFHDLPFEQSMTAILGSLGYYWERDGDLIRVREWKTELYTINYLRLVRSGAGSSEASISSGSSGGSDGGDDSGGGSGESGKISIEQENRIEFWKDLEEQLKKLVSEKGRLVINQVAGTVQVSDSYRRVKEISNYINEVNDAIQRQVDIEVRILEVTLNDDFSLGIDWSRLVSAGNTGTNVDFTLTNIITSPVGTGTALPAAVSLTASDIATTGENRLSALVSALEQQGEVQIVSQPHIRTLNNQSALIKVGTDRTFFRREQNTDTTSAGSSTTTTDVPQVVTEGIVLSITPQISREGWVMMDISPVVTRVSSVSEVRGPGGNVESSAPNLDIRQTSSLVRAFNGETVILGGLIQTQEARTDRGVPGINRVPAVGGLFRGEYTSVIKKELIIFLTPKLVDPHKTVGG